MTNIESRLRKLVAEHLGINTSQIDPEAKIRDDLGADSMDMIELIMLAEDEFDITIGEDEEESVSDGTFGQLCELVAGKNASCES